MKELLPRAMDLVKQAAKANIGFNIDAEEQDRLDLSLDVIEAMLSDPALEGWDGFGVVVQAYGRRAAPVIETLYDMAERLDRKIMVRLVKGAYWDTEIKLAQEMGVKRFPGLHPQGQHRSQLHGLRQDADGPARPDLSAIRHA